MVAATKPVTRMMEASGAHCVLADVSRRMPFDILDGKITVPEVRADSISRTALVNRLRARTATRVVALIGPAGYGKTTLLAQWAARDDRPFVWVSADTHDNDAVRLLRHLAAALDRVSPIDGSVFDALAHPGASLWTSAVSRLARAASQLPTPVVLVLDDAHLVRDANAADALYVISEHLPAESVLAIAARSAPPLSLPMLRARGELLELGADELAFTRREVELLMREARLDLPAGELDELTKRTEGWAAALSLVSLSLVESAQRPATRRSVDVTGDRHVAEYLAEEYFSSLDPGDLDFMRKTAVLDRVCGSLCDAVLGVSRSGERLASVERANQFLVPVDDRHDWYRYHRLLRDILRQDIARREPESISELHSRAADWFESHGDDESALDHAANAGDVARAARLTARLVRPVYDDGRIATVEAWLDEFDDDNLLEQYPAIAAHGARFQLWSGHSAEAARWLAAAEAGTEGSSDESVAVQPLVAAVRAAACQQGVRQMFEDADEAVSTLPRRSEWLTEALIVRGVAFGLMGDRASADADFAAAALAAERLGQVELGLLAVTERLLLGGESWVGRDGAATAEEAAWVGFPTAALHLVTNARSELKCGNWDAARAQLAKAQQLTPFLNNTLPWLAVQTRVEMARAYVTLRDAAAAAATLVEVDAILSRRSDLGSLLEDVRVLRSEVVAMPLVKPGRAAGLTGAELRLLPLLATHLSFREIGVKLFVSRNTIKTQAISVYRKLGVSTRSEAVERAQALGLSDLGE